MQQPADEPFPLHYQAPRPKGRFSPAVVLAVTGLVAPVHFGAFILSALMGYSCCSSNGSSSASAVSHALGFPLLHLMWLINPEQLDGFFLMFINSLIWGAALGTALSLLIGRRPDDV